MVILGSRGGTEKDVHAQAPTKNHLVMESPTTGLKIDREDRKEVLITGDLKANMTWKRGGSRTPGHADSVTINSDKI